MKAKVNAFKEALKGGESMTHEELRKILKKSKKTGQRALFDEYCGYVYAIVFNKLRSCAAMEDIEECVGDVFADIYIFYDSEGDFSGDVKGFIGTVARRKAIDTYNRLISKKIAAVPIDDEESQNIESPENVEDIVAQKELRRILLDKIAELGEPDSTIIIQKYYYGRTAKEISDIVSLTPENIRVRSGRAIKRLKEKLEKENITL